MPKRRNFGSRAGRTALLHALAHIELNAIDLAWDIVARFAANRLPRAFFDDWVGVAANVTAARSGIAIATAARWTGFDKARAITFTNASPRA